MLCAGDGTIEIGFVNPNGVTHEFFVWVPVIFLNFKNHCENSSNCI